MKVIGIVGRAGSGKDSLANHLRRCYGSGVKLSFAAPLKRLCCRLFGWDQRMLVEMDGTPEGLAYKEAPSEHPPLAWTWELAVEVCRDQFGHAAPHYVEHLRRELSKIEPSWTRRQILQHVGTECFRALDPLHWVKRAMQQVDEVSGSADFAVFTDLRFQNEADAIRERGGAIVRTVCEGREGTLHRDHASEVGVDSIRVDRELSAAYGCLPYLYEQGDELAASLGLRERWEK